MKKILFYVAVAGWALGLIVHLLSAAGTDVADKVPFIRLLHIGIFIVWIPAILELNKNKLQKASPNTISMMRMSSSDFYKALFGHCPKWLVIIAIGGFVYAFINFILFVTTRQGMVNIEGGQYVLHDFGQTNKTISEQEYHLHKAYELRGFSGHWIAFYGVAAAVLFPYGKAVH